jgi:Mn-dependent DtxR family transcriptional regulator
MQKENISRFFKNGSSEDYLTAVCEICEETGGAARQIEIAAHMGVTGASTIRGLNVLVKKNLVTIERDGNSKYARLTAEGRAQAKKILRRRRIAAAFLASLGLSESAALAEAHLWQHGVSDETADAMEAALNARENAPGAPAEPVPSALIL